MRNRILLITDALVFGGVEKLLYELSKFAIANNLKPTVLILDNFEKEYYDNVLKKEKIKVFRIKISGIKRLLKQFDFKSACWNIIIRYFINKIFLSVHILKLEIAVDYYSTFRKIEKYIWHVTNEAQFKNTVHYLPDKVFESAQDTLIYINKYQQKELQRRNCLISCKEVLFKLFIV